MPFTMMEMMKGSAMEKRRRVKHEKTFEERLAEEAQRFKEAVDKLLTARPGNYFYGGLAKLRRQLTSMSGRVRPTAASRLIGKLAVRSEEVRPPQLATSLLSSGLQASLAAASKRSLSSVAGEE